jgi:hypothetical protein
MEYYLVEALEDGTLLEKINLTKYEFSKTKEMHHRLKQKKERV